MERGGWLLTYGAIFLGGLALNLTPCVYPLVPITVGFFSGQGQVRRTHAAGLSLLYVLGIYGMIVHLRRRRYLYTKSPSCSSASTARTVASSTPRSSGRPSPGARSSAASLPGSG